MSRLLRALIAMVLLLVMTLVMPVGRTPAESALLAFPSAEGFGARSVGGRGGSVIEVTHLGDSGEGSLRTALQAIGPRTIVFRTGGTIDVKSPIVIRNPYVTIAGQTAPGDGITVRNDPDNWANVRTPIVIATHDVVVRHLRIRPGVGNGVPDPWSPAPSVDGLRVAGTNPTSTYNVIIDHCSLSWALDENVQLGDNAQDVTVQWSIISEGLHQSVHPDGVHSRGLLTTGATSGRLSVHHNLFAHNEERNPQVSNSNQTDVVNNVIYNYKTKAISSSDAGSNGSNPVEVNVVGNYVKRGPDSVRNHREVDLFPTLDPTPGWRLHLARNIGPFRTDDDQPQTDALNPEDLAYYTVSSPVFESPELSAVGPLAAFDQVLDRAGATRPSRDAVDRRVVGDVRNGTGTLIDSQDDVGAWPNMDAGTPPTDTDHDGMPDDWEIAEGLDPSDPGDGPQPSPNGYTWLEDYLNELAGDLVPAFPIEVDSLAAGGAGTNARAYVTDPISPASGDLVLVFVVNAVGNGTARSPILSGNGLSWEQAATALDGSRLRRLTLFRAMGSSPSSGPLTVSFPGQTQARIAWSVVSVSETAGTVSSNGSEAILQLTTAGGLGTSGSVTLANAAQNPHSRPFVSFWHVAAESSTPRLGWTEIHDVTTGTEKLSLETQWRDDAFEQEASASWSSKVRWGAIAFELRAQ